MEVKLSKYTESLLKLLKERLDASDTEVIESAIVQMFREYEQSIRAQEVMEGKLPIPLIEVMEKSGLLD